MDIDKVTKISTLASLLRSEIAQNAGKKNRAASSGMEGGKSATNGKPGARELDQQIVSKIKRLDTDDSQFRSRAMKIIVESILTWEFGDHIANDPEFSGLIDKITTTIQSSEKLTTLYNDYCGIHS